MTFRVVELFYFGHILVRLVLNSCPSSIVDRNRQSREYLVEVKYSLAMLVFIGHTVEETSDTPSGHIFSLPMSFLGHILFFVHIFIFFWPFWTVLDILLPIERGPSPSPWPYFILCPYFYLFLAILEPFGHTFAHRARP